MEPALPLSSTLSALARLLNTDISLRRTRIPKRSPTDARAEQASQRSSLELQRMQLELTALLDAYPENRRALDQLAAVEQQLRLTGLEFLQTMPLPQLREALRQFEAAVTYWGHEGLACLRSKMAVAVRQRTPQPAPRAGLQASATAHRSLASLQGSGQAGARA